VVRQVENQSPKGQVCPYYVHSQTHTLSTGDTGRRPNPDAARGQVPGIAPWSTPNVAHAYSHEATPPRSQATWYVLAPRTEIKTFPREQTPFVQMCPQTGVDLWDTTLGVRETVPHADHPTFAVKPISVYNQSTVVPFEPYIAQ